MWMSRSLLTPDQFAELSALYREHEERAAQARVALREKGMESPEFREADAATGKTWSRIRELLGDAGKHWSA